MRLMIVARISLSALLVAALAASCTDGAGERDDASVLGTKFTSGPCALAGGSTITPGLHSVTAANAPLILVVTGGRAAGLAPAQQIQRGDPPPSPEPARILDFTLGVRDGTSSGTVTVTLRLRNTTGCSVEFRDGSITVQPTDPPGAPITLSVRFAESDRLLVPPGGEATATATHRIAGDGSSDVTGTIAAAVGVVRSS